jgi:hypothetical protein
VILVPSSSRVNCGLQLRPGVSRDRGRSDGSSGIGHGQVRMGSGTLALEHSLDMVMVANQDATFSLALSTGFSHWLCSLVAVVHVLTRP